MKYLGYVAAFVLGAAVSWLFVTKNQPVSSETLVSEMKNDTDPLADKQSEQLQTKASIKDGLQEESMDNDEARTKTQEIAALEQQLAVMKSTNAQLTQRLQEAKQPPKAEQSDDADNNPDLFADVPESHKKLLEPKTDAPKTLDQLHEELVEQEEDISWATLKEQQLSYFINSHRYSNFIDIHLIQCKTNLCEILGTEVPSDNESWFTINDEMMREPWADFSGNSTSSNNGENGNKIFVTILKQRPANNQQKVAP
ncbi:MAG: hypothetical protein HWE16_18330 [Gammaproteobacteria bacterium]|nr:hypothetical protein [Gammaproteobacteria bacterium]